MKQKKVIIYDPVCGIYKGHNLPTINKYAEWIRTEFGYDCESWTALKDLKTNSNLVNRNIPWVYDYWLYENLSMKEELKAKKRIIKNESIVQIIANTMHHSKAQKKIEGSLLKALGTQPDYVFFPGADFYSLTSILAIARKGKISKSTKLIIRLMGVMEWATKLPRAREIVNQVLFEIKIYLGEQALFTAETEKYAFEISSIINAPVIVTPIPTNKQKEIPTQSINSTKHTYNLACLGGARPDKGYFDLLDICQQTLVKFNKEHGANVNFIIQSMNPTSIEYDWHYQVELSKLPNTKLLKPRLTDEELNTEIRNSDIIFLPYSSSTYAGRGSAILFDTLHFGKPILGVAGTGYGDSIMHAGLGLTYDGIDDYFNRLSDLIHLSNKQREMISENQNTYSEELLNNLRKCFQ